MLCGVGILSTSYGIKEGGWSSLLLLPLLGGSSCYTGLLLKRCIDSSPNIGTYPDIGQAAFGVVGRIFVSVCIFPDNTDLSSKIISLVFFFAGCSLLGALCKCSLNFWNLLWMATIMSLWFFFFYIYLQASCVEYITLLGDSMSSVFPSAHLAFAGIDMNAHTLFAITTALAILPTVCLRNLSLLSYLSGMLKCRILTALLLFFPLIFQRTVGLF